VYTVHILFFLFRRILGHAPLVYLADRRRKRRRSR